MSSAPPATIEVLPSDDRWGLPHMLLGAGAIVVLVLVSYLPLVNAEYIWDDNDYVTENLTLRSAAGLRRIWFEIGAVPQYYPLVHSTFWVEYHLWAQHPFGYHLVNVLLHACGALLLWRLLGRLNVPGAWLAAALFAVHPVEVESVAWVTERKNVLSLVLALSAVLCYLRFAPLTDDESGSGTTSPRWRWYALSLLFFAGAMLSKTVVATLPAVLLVLVWWKRGRIAWADVLPLLPLFAVGIALGYLTVWMEKYRVGAEGADWDYSGVDRVLIAGRVLWFYAAKLAWPHPLAFFYARWNIDSTAPWQCAFPLAALATMAALWIARGRIGRGPLAAVLIFAGVLTPALGFLNVYPFRFSFVADHFQYHASVALHTLTAAVAATVWGRMPRGLRPVTRCATAAVLIGNSALTFHQTHDYQDLETLYRHTIAKSPDSWAPYLNLGSMLEGQGLFDESIEMGRAGVRLNPNEPAVHNNLGAALLRKGIRDGFAPGQLEEIITVFGHALELGKARPGLAHIEQVARSNLAFALLKLGMRDGFGPEQFDSIFRNLQEALRRDPNYFAAYNTLGFALLAADRPQEAVDSFASALRIEPEFPQSLCGMGTALAALGQKDAAREYLQRALAQDPGCSTAQYQLALQFIDDKNTDLAVKYLEAAIRGDPRFAEAYYALGGVLATRGDFPAAAEKYKKAVQLRPNYHLALNNLGVVSINMGDAQAAEQYFAEALRRKPDYNEARVNLERVRQLQTEQQSDHPPATP